MNTIQHSNPAASTQPGTPETQQPGSRASRLLSDFSLEITGRDLAEIAEAAPLLAPGARVNVTYLASEDLPLRIEAARAVVGAGLTPVPHIAARRVRAQAELEEYLGALHEAGASDRIFAVGGDPHTPEGPYASALDLIRSGVLPEHGVTHVGIGGYPEGHPDISDDELWSSLTEKASELERSGLSGSIITQFGFNEEPILRWIERLRDTGITLPVAVGVPGPAGVKRLLGFARRFGVASSAGILKKYGLSMTNLIGTAGPDRLIDSLAAGIEPGKHGAVGVHFYTFGGVTATARWTHEYTVRNR